MFIFYKQIASLAAAFPSFAQTEQKCCCMQDTRLAPPTPQVNERFVKLGNLQPLVTSNPVLVGPI